MSSSRTVGRVLISGILVASACTTQEPEPPAGGEDPASTTNIDEDPASSGAPDDPESSTGGDDPGASTGSDQTASTDTGEPDEPLEVEAVVELYGLAWNTQDARERQSLLEQAWAPDAVYRDPVTVEQGLDGAGIDGLVEVIELNHQLFPGFSIDLSTDIDHYEGLLRFSWLYHLPDGTQLPGLDFGEYDPHTGQLLQITGFFGELPASAPVSSSLQAYLDAWNEADPQIRLELLNQAMSDGAIYRDPTVAVEGRPALAEHIGVYQQQAAGTELVLSAGPDSYGTVMRFTWAIQTLGGDVVGTGLDIVDLADDGRLSRVIGFFDFDPGA